MAELDWARLRELARELGFWPATTNPEDIERHRRLNKALDAAPDLAPRRSSPTLPRPSGRVNPSISIGGYRWVHPAAGPAVPPA